VAVARNGPATLFASGPAGGVFRSDGGIRWTPIGNDLKDTVIWNVVMDPASDSTLYAATFAGLCWHSPFRRPRRVVSR
jgi:hypothetical protein